MARVPEVPEGRRFQVGERVELYPTIPSDLGEYSIESGTLGIVQEVMGDGYGYRVRFLDGDRLTDDEAWLDAIDVMGVEPPQDPV